MKSTLMHRRSQRGCSAPRAEKKLLVPYLHGKMCKCTQAERAPPSQSKSSIFEEIGEIWTVRVINLVVLACVLRATTKKGRELLGEEKCTPEKILPTPMTH